MRQLLVICVAAVAACCFTGCEKEGKGKLDPSAKVYISPAKLPQAVTGKVADQATAHLTPLEVVEQSEAIYTNVWSLGIGDWNRDIANSRFVVGSDWAINQEGELTYEFIGARNYIFVKIDQNLRPKDTVAYIPNAIMQTAETAIKAAYDAENYPECYRLLQEAFVFTPITGAEYKALQANGEN